MYTAGRAVSRVWVSTDGQMQLPALPSVGHLHAFAGLIFEYEAKLPPAAAMRMPSVSAKAGSPPQTLHAISGCGNRLPVLNAVHLQSSLHGLGCQLLKCQDKQRPAAVGMRYRRL